MALLFALLLGATAVDSTTAAAAPAAKSSSTIPFSIPQELATNATTPVFIVGSGFEAKSGASARCKLNGGTGWDLDAVASAVVGAVVHNSTHASCVPPPMRLGGPVTLQLALDGEHYSLSVPLTYFPLLSATVARRPYTSEPTGSVLVRVHSSVPQPRISAEVLQPDGSWRMLITSVAIRMTRGDSDAFKLAFPLPRNTTSAWGVPLRVSLRDGGTIVAQANTSLVLLGGATANQGVVDFENRTLLYGSSFVPVGPANGFDNHFEAAAMIESPAMVWKLASRGFNTLVLDGTTDLTVSLAAMDLLADAGIRVLYLLREYADTNVPNSTLSWAHLVTNVRAVQNHPSLLGYYVWDDCCGQYRNKAVRYRALKVLDPHHPLISPVISIGDEYLYGRDGDTFDGDGWDTAFDVGMYESYVLPSVDRTMDAARVMLHYPMDWQLLWVMGELSDLQDLSAAESPAQVKVMHYLQFIAGVVGQVWFVLSDSTPRQLLDAAAESGTQLNSLAPAICRSVTRPATVTATASSSAIHVSAFEA
eukprot:COSAG05_NODE_1203_length_5535_cov_21.291575_1_plen_534_part_00